MLEKSRNAVFFQWFVCRVSRRVGSLKRRVRSHVVRGEIKNCTPLWREAHFEVKMYKTHQLRTTFWSWDVEKLHAAVARSTFWSENAKKTQGFGALFEVEMFKNGTPLWREAHFEVKVYKTPQLRTTFRSYNVENCTPLWREAHFQLKMLKKWRSRSTFWSWDVEKLHAAVARSIFPSQNVQNTCVLPHFFKFRCRKNILPHSFKFRCLKISQVVS